MLSFARLGVVCLGISCVLGAGCIGTDTPVVGTGSAIVVDYIGTLADGSVFDTSIESVARSGNVYQAGRDYTTGLPFTVGSGQMIAGFDAGVRGMKVGETKTITIPAKEAYGEATISVGIDQLPVLATGSYIAGSEIPTQDGTVKVISVDTGTNTAVVENPHKMGGKDLTFQITIKSIK